MDIDRTNGNQDITRDDDFEWDDIKAADNEREHRISFEMARAAFSDAFSIVRVDRGHDDPADRYAMLGMVEDRLLFVSDTLRAERIGIISARQAEPREPRRYHNENRQV
jgi:uncharacterized DUF497 family protein